MPDTIGPHLLGRVKSQPDPRNWQLAPFLNPAPLAALNDAVQKSKLTPHAVKAWIAEATKELAALVPAPPAPPEPPTSTRWADAHQLDQGQTPHCVGFGWSQYGNTLPVDDGYADADGHALYYACKVIDGEPGQENGSSVHSGAKAMKNQGRIDGYAWASNLDEIKQWVLTKGPVTVGTLWTNDMFNPDASGFVHPTGGVAGGHCYVLLGYDQITDVLTFQNSWGASWGDNGYFRMHASEWWDLYSRDNDGEACVALELAK